MSALIEELKGEHAEIIAMLNEVKELGIPSKEGQARLMSIKESLLAHIKKEEEQFYPVLRKEAEINKHLESILDLLAVGMMDVSRVALEFFDKYSRGVSGKEFPKELENLLAALGKRIRNEEDILFPEYEKINQSLL
ncbi:MAG: hemerythrin domain-containing protein [Candidatus Scalindua sp.]